MSGPPKMKDVPQNLKPYFVVFLIKGERWDDTEGAEATEIMPRHLAFLREQTENHRYLVAGPLLDDGRVAGLIVMQATSIEEATAIAVQDPAVQSKRLAVEIHPSFLPSLDTVQVQY